MAATMLATALQQGAIKNQIRFCWWAAEERGLLGSKHYVADLMERGEEADVALNMNFDMLASPNGVRSVYNGSDTSAQVAQTVNGSTFIMEAFEV